MNFNKILTQFDHAELQNRILDHKFMSAHTYQTKYKDQHIVHKPLRLTHQSDQAFNKPLKKKKHRYFEDIEQDEIEDANVFGYSTFDYFSFFKKNSHKIEQTSNALVSKHVKKRLPQQKNNKTTQKNGLSNESKLELSASFTRPKIAIVSLGTPTKRKVHHKLSLNQIQRVDCSNNLLTASIKQHYFTEQIFDFNPVDNLHSAINNERCKQRMVTLKEHSPTQAAYNNKKSRYYLENQSEKPSKKHLIFQQTITKFNTNQNQDKNLKKKQKKHIDQQNIKKQKQNFVKGISGHFENLGKQAQFGNGCAGMARIGDLQSVVYERQANKRKVNEEIAHYTQSIHEKTIHPSHSSKSSQSIIINAKNNRPFKNHSPDQTLSIPNDPNQKHQFVTQPPISEPQLSMQLKLSSSISIFQSINLLLLQRGYLHDLQFKYDQNFSPLHYSAFDKSLIHAINNHCTEVTDFRSKSLQHFNARSLSRLPRQKAIIYNIWLVECVSLDWVKLENVELQNQSFVYKENQMSLLLVAKRMMNSSLPSNFVHLMITRNVQGQQLTNCHLNNSQILVFQTFIHNSDIKYFEGREVQIQYFKYFLKRFITFDSSVQKKDHILSSVSLVFESEVKTPVEFENFCQQMKIKDNINIVALRNIESKEPGLSFRPVEISLSKLLLDASETVMMVKKELIEGYDWRGVSLTKGIKQYRGYHLEHFYI